ncbi:prostaglandin reductase 3 [Trichonephila inaurata madagascariensis]|uniref:Prostaglandin reductase 3 n=1 Tax=Trichonephila inaurata madagascariensis TaxID=2747483 RepID=A0A8X6KCR0_9ARAC|nr:prostaglandin reductase 3 [Trichonephila inaurata madagascariensis]
MNSRVNSYGEYVCLSADEAYPIPEPKPEYLVLLVSGASASIGLDKCARITAEDKVLITAAAGGAGHIAVQWAKAAGCYVIGTCSSEEKEKVLKNLGLKGRLIIVGGISSYKSEDSFLPKLDLSFLPELLLLKSASIHGFRRAEYRDCFATYFKFMSESLEKEDLRGVIDNGEKSTGKEFYGLEGIIDGVEYLHSGKSIGKVIARLC